MIDPKELDEIGRWSEVKLEIIEKYARPYSEIVNRKFKSIYIDAFAGYGVHLSEASGEIVDGSPLRALKVDFSKYYLIDIKEARADFLNQLALKHPGKVNVFHGDCNQVLLQDVFPKVKYEDYRRGLCLLDPYGLHLDWEVIETAGKMRSIEIFLNFPIMDMNMNVLKDNPDSIQNSQMDRMDRFWGDRSWWDAVYSKESNLFGIEMKVGSNKEIVQAFKKRLKDKAGFKYVPEPLPMKNRTNAVVYYLFFASHNPTGDKIVQDIFGKYK